MHDSDIKEIDLFVVLKKVIKFLFKYKLILLPLFIIGIILAQVQIKNNQKSYNDYYLTQFYVESSIVSDEIIFTMLNNLSYTFIDIKGEEYDQNVVKSIRGVRPVKELSIDGLRTDVRAYIYLREEQKMEDVIKMTRTYIESTEYFKLRYDIVSKQQQLVLNLLNDKLERLNFDKKDVNLSSKIMDKSKDNTQEYLNYITLIEKKQEVEKNIIFLNKKVEFVPFEPDCAPFSNRNHRTLLMINYSLVLTMLGVILILIFNFIKRITSK